MAPPSEPRPTSLMPITSPCKFTSGPPLLPWKITAWRLQCSPSRLVAETANLFVEGYIITQRSQSAFFPDIFLRRSRCSAVRTSIAFSSCVLTTSLILS
jgi:hypothetical protein